MQLNQIKPRHKSKRKKRIGRGGKRGTYSGRGMKGQKARAGAKFQPFIREVIKKYPKLKGYRQKVRKKIQAGVNLSTLEKKFKAEEEVSPGVLLERGIIRKIKGRIPQVKILAKGELKKKLIVKDCRVSQPAKEKIEKAGGRVKEQPR